MDISSPLPRQSVKIRIRMLLTKIIHRVRYCRYRLKGYDIRPDTKIERDVTLDRWNPRGIHIGSQSTITSRCVILAHKNVIVNDQTWQEEGIAVDTYIGDRTLVGIGTIVLPGVRIGNQCVIAAGSVVTRDIPDRSIAAGNPARILKENIDLLNRPY